MFIKVYDINYDIIIIITNNNTLFYYFKMESLCEATRKLFHLRTKCWCSKIDMAVHVYRKYDKMTSQSIIVTKVGISKVLVALSLKR